MKQRAQAVAGVADRRLGADHLDAGVGGTGDRAEDVGAHRHPGGEQRLAVASQAFEARETGARRDQQGVGLHGVPVGEPPGEREIGSGAGRVGLERGQIVAGALAGAVDGASAVERLADGERRHVDLADVRDQHERRPVRRLGGQKVLGH
ncbi:MAG: hypothetical protein H6Q02_1789 [Acidobacteria bacterium]|nr:hypothetical protein [Acidobacteriota bacterium]